MSSRTTTAEGSGEKLWTWIIYEKYYIFNYCNFPNARNESNFIGILASQCTPRKKETEIKFACEDRHW